MEYCATYGGNVLFFPLRFKAEQIHSRETERTYQRRRLNRHYRREGGHRTRSTIRQCNMKETKTVGPTPNIKKDSRGEERRVAQCVRRNGLLPNREIIVAKSAAIASLRGKDASSVSGLSLQTQTQSPIPTRSKNKHKKNKKIGPQSESLFWGESCW